MEARRYAAWPVCVSPFALRLFLVLFVIPSAARFGRSRGTCIFPLNRPRPRFSHVLRQREVEPGGPHLPAVGKCGNDNAAPEARQIIAPPFKAGVRSITRAAVSATGRSPKSAFYDFSFRRSIPATPANAVPDNNMVPGSGVGWVKNRSVSESTDAVCVVNAAS
jgi:hypothetical protein